MNTSTMRIAWDIAYEIMTRSNKLLLLTVLHPGGEQYNCLAITKYDDQTQQLLINLYGDSISVNGRLLSPYPDLYKKDKAGLVADVSRLSGFRLAPYYVRELHAMRFLKHLIDKTYDDSRLNITSAWYDGAYSSTLSESAKDFPFYEHSDIEDRRLHLPWWTISYLNQTIAMCNIDTNDFLTLHGNHFNLNDETERNLAWMEIDKVMMLDEINDIVIKTRKLISDNDEWVERYREYAKIITENIDSIKEARKAFHEWSPLKFYLNVSNAKGALSNLTLGVRYLGQEVAQLTYKKAKRDTPYLDTKRYDGFNLKYFGYNKSLDMVDWHGDESKEFRAFFKRYPKKLPTATKGNEEHRIESLLLTEFSKHKSEDKAFPYIQPVKIGRIRFPMPTPISASNHKTVKYSGFSGGGIDILTRVGKSGLTAKLCIIELKDENTRKEPPIDVIKQAVAYATFIRELLRSDAKDEWWNLFGFSKQVPKKLTLLAACAMPYGDYNDYSFANHEIKIGEDVIRLHYIYFEEIDNKIICIESSLKEEL